LLPCVPKTYLISGSVEAESGGGYIMVNGRTATR
jgi:hypothetical protein